MLWVELLVNVEKGVAVPAVGVPASFETAARLDEVNGAEAGDADIEDSVANGTLIGRVDMSNNGDSRCGKTMMRLSSGCYEVECCALGLC